MYGILVFGILSYAGVIANEQCWAGDFTEATCCFPLENKGNAACWDGVYDFDFCCAGVTRDVSSATKPLQLLQDEQCWTGEYKRDACCYPLDGGGQSGCWQNGARTFKGCCGDLVRERARSGWCWASQASRDRTFFFHRLDFISESILGHFGIKLQAEMPPYSEHKCCHPLPFGLPSCFDRFFNFETCCSHLSHGRDLNHKIDGKRNVVLIDDDLCFQQESSLREYSGSLYPSNYEFGRLRYFGRPAECVALGHQFRWVSVQFLQQDHVVDTQYTSLCLSNACSKEGTQRIVKKYVDDLTRGFVTHNMEVRSVSTYYFSFNRAIAEATQGILFWPLVLFLLPVVCGTILQLFGKRNDVSLQSGIRQLVTVGSSGRMIGADVCRTMLLVLMLVHHISIGELGLLDEGSAYVDVVADSILHHLVNNGIFFIAGFFLARRKSVGLSLLVRKMYRQSAVTALVSLWLQHHNELFSSLSHVPAAAHHRSKFAAHLDEYHPDVHLGVPWSVLPVLPGVSYYLPFWAMPFEFKAFIVMLVLRWLRCYNTRIGSWANIALLVFAMWMNCLQTAGNARYNYMQAYCWAALIHDYQVSTRHPWKYLVVGVMVFVLHGSVGMNLEQPFGYYWSCFYNVVGRIPFFVALSTLLPLGGNCSSKLFAGLTWLCHFCSTLSMATIFSHALVYDLFHKVWFLNEYVFDASRALLLALAMCVSALLVGFILFVCIERPWNNLLIKFEGVLLPRQQTVGVHTSKVCKTTKTD